MTETESGLRAPVRYRFNFLSNILQDAVWLKVLTLGVILLFLLLGDAILSFWVPNFLEDTFSSSFLMGVIMSFSSIVGLFCDLLLPQVLMSVTVKRLFLMGVISSLFFALLLGIATFIPNILIILVAVAVWGLYYELIGFGQQQFVADSIPLSIHASTWGILGIFRSLSYFLGPLIAGLLIARGERVPLVFAMILVAIGLVLLILTRDRHKRITSIEFHEVSLRREMSHWNVLFEHVWPVVVLSLMMGLVDSAFWTVGAVWTEKLSETSIWGTLILPFYIMPSIFMGFVIAKLGIFKGKKKLSEKLLLMSGLFLFALGMTDSIFARLIFVLASGILIAAAMPLTDAVYSDITARMGRERKHLIGLSQSTVSFAYIVGPLISGYISEKIGEGGTFSVFGALVVVVSFLLLLFTPRKLKIPQSDIQAWE